MELPALCIAPHEVGDLAPGELLRAPAQHRVAIKKWWGSDFYLLRSLETGHPFSTVCVRQQNKAGAPLLWLDEGTYLASIVYSAELESVLSDGVFTRHLYFDARGQLASALGDWHALLEISSSGETLWRGRDDKPFHFVWRNVHFKHRFDAHWRRETPDAGIAREVAAMLADTNSDCAYAWNWLSLSSRQRERELFVVARGTLNEVERVLRAAFGSEADAPQNENWSLIVHVGIGAGTEFYAGGATEIAWGSALRDGDGQKHALSARQTRKLEVVLRHFELWRNWRAQIYTLVRELWMGGVCHWTIALPTVSAHEQLEAALCWRAWLRDQVSPEAWAELAAP